MVSLVSISKESGNDKILMEIFKKWLFREPSEIYKTIGLLPFLSFGCISEAVEIFLSSLVFVNDEQLAKSLMDKLLE